MSEDVSQQQSPVMDHIQRVRGLLAGYEAKFASHAAREDAALLAITVLQEQISSAQGELSAVRAEKAADEAAFSAQFGADFLTRTAPPLAVSQPAPPPAENAEVEVEVEVEAETEAPIAAASISLAKPPAVAAKAPAAKAGRNDNGKTSTTIRPPIKKEPGHMTVPERIAAVMGDRVMTASEVERELVNAGDDLHSNNLKSYIATALSSAEVRVPGPDGVDLRDREGKIFKTRKFVSVERGKYRVATKEDIRAAVLEAFGYDVFATESDIPTSETDESGSTPADALFAEQGIDVRPAMAAQ